MMGEEPWSGGAVACYGPQFSHILSYPKSSDTFQYFLTLSTISDRFVIRIAPMKSLSIIPPWNLLEKPYPYKIHLSSILQSPVSLQSSVVSCISQSVCLASLSVHLFQSSSQAESVPLLSGLAVVVSCGVL